MEENNAYLWVGTFENEELAVGYLEVPTIDCDFDCNNSEGGKGCDDPKVTTFEKNFGIKYMDTDFMEYEYTDEMKKSIKELLEGFSWDNQLIPKFEELLKDTKDIQGNVLVLVSDIIEFEYDETTVSDKGDGYSIQYLGKVSFDSDEEE